MFWTVLAWFAPTPFVQRLVRLAGLFTPPLSDLVRVFALAGLGTVFLLTVAGGVAALRSPEAA